MCREHPRWSWSRQAAHRDVTLGGMTPGRQVKALRTGSSCSGHKDAWGPRAGTQAGRWPPERLDLGPVTSHRPEARPSSAAEKPGCAGEGRSQARGPDERGRETARAGPKDARGAEGGERLVISADFTELPGGDRNTRVTRERHLLHAKTKSSLRVCHAKTCPREVRA